MKQGYRLIVVDKDGVLVSEFQLTEQALAAPEAFVAALKESVEAIEEAEPWPIQPSPPGLSPMALCTCSPFERGTPRIQAA